MFYEKYLDAKEIQSRKERFGFPDARFIELLIYDYEIFRHLLKASDRFYLKGGAAAQLFTELSQQRASKDIDLVTDHTPQEIDKIFAKINDVFPSKKHIPAKIVHDVPMVTYLVEVNSIVEDGEKLEIKADILIEDLKNYKLGKVPASEVFALNTGIDLPVISLGSLLADKFLTLAQKSIGIPHEKISEYPKQVYDLARITKRIDRQEFSNMAYSFQRIMRSELKTRRLENTSEEVILHILDVLEQFAKLDEPVNAFKNYINDFQSAYVSREARKTTSGWIADSLILMYLVKIFRRVIIKGEDESQVYAGWVSFIKELDGIRKLDIENRKKIREELIGKLRKAHPQWKKYKGSSEERIFLELKHLVE